MMTTFTTGLATFNVDHNDCEDSIFASIKPSDDDSHV